MIRCQTEAFYSQSHLKYRLVKMTPSESDSCMSSRILITTADSECQPVALAESQSYRQNLHASLAVFPGKVNTAFGVLTDMSRGSFEDIEVSEIVTSALSLRRASATVSNTASICVITPECWFWRLS